MCLGTPVSIHSAILVKNHLFPSGAKRSAWIGIREVSLTRSGHRKGPLVLAGGEQHGRARILQWSVCAPL